jgi:hypothetical protein
VTPFPRFNSAVFRAVASRIEVELIVFDDVPGHVVAEAAFVVNDGLNATAMTGFALALVGIAHASHSLMSRSHSIGGGGEKCQARLYQQHLSIWQVQPKDYTR